MSTSTNHGTKLPFITRLHAALGADGATIQPPKMPSGIDTAILKRVGIVPPELRGLAALHFDTLSAMLGYADKLYEMRAACIKQSKCACKSGFDMANFKKEGDEILRQLKLLTRLIGPDLKKSLGGFAFGGFYVIDTDWSVMPTPQEDERRMKRALDLMQQRMGADLGEDHSRSSFGSPLDGIFADGVMIEVIDIVDMRGSGRPFGGAFTLSDLLGRFADRRPAHAGARG